MSTRDYIPYGRQKISEADKRAVLEVLESDFLTQGPVVPAFEQALADFCGAKFAIACNSATSALHVACLALGVEKSSVLWTSPITFVSSANCALFCGATVDFVDIDEQTFNMCPLALKEKLESAESKDELPDVVVVVHMCGQSADMKSIGELSKKYGFRVIEDASHAVGGSYYGQYVGSCRYSDVTIFSFHPVKILTTGEGGMAVTNDADLANMMVELRSHGITRDPERMESPPHGDWYYQQIRLGFNYRMTDIAAALGLSQFGDLNRRVEDRNRLAGSYDRLLTNLEVTTPFIKTGVVSSFHLYVIKLTDKKIRKTAFDMLREEGIGVNVHYIPVPTQPFYKRIGGWTEESFPKSTDYYQRAISLPMYPELTLEMQKRVVRTLAEALAL